MLRTAARCLPILLVLATAASAQTVDVSLDPNESGPLAVGQDFVVDIVADNGGDGNIIGGGLSFSFDPAVVRVSSVTLADDVLALPLFPGRVSPIDNTAGRIDLIGFSPFPGPSGSFTIATVNLTAIGLGIDSVLGINNANDAVFAWAVAGAASGSNIALPTFEDGVVAVVPLPGAAWLLLSGIGVLGLRRKLTRS